MIFEFNHLRYEVPEGIDIKVECLSHPVNSAVAQTEAQTEPLFVVRHYDGFDNEWMDVSEPVSKDEAQRLWDEKTDDGTRNTKYDDIDYYAIFPADTVMRYSTEGKLNG